MRTRREPKAEPDANHGPTRGVRLLLRPDRPNPYGVQWSERAWDPSKAREVRKVKTEFFRDAADRDRRAAAKREERRLGLAATPDRPELLEWRAFRAAIGPADWREVVAVWQRSRLTSGAVDSSKTVGEWAKTYLARAHARMERQEIAANTYRHFKHKIGLFCEFFRLRPLNRVTSEDVEAWLDGCATQAAGTFNNYHKIVSGLFRDAVHHRLIGENPFARVPLRKIVAEEAAILTVPQIAQLFHTAQTVERFRVCLWRLAMETFAGVRYSSACRLERSDVDPIDKGIRHPARSIKTGKRQYVSPFPDNLFAWLAAAPDDAALNYTDERGNLNRERRYLALKSALFVAAGVPHPRNCLRHTFPSYHLAARQDPGKTSYLLCHRNQQKLWDNYKGNATAAEGLRFESLTPPTVAAVAREWRERADPPAAAAPAPSRDQPETGPAPAGG